MTQLNLPLTGGCRCGKVRIEVSAQPLMTAACHCHGCQKMSASAYSLTAMIPTEGFRVVEGDPVVGGTHGPQQDHMFCSYCMTWMFTRITGMGDFVNLRPTMLDDVSWFTPFIETMTSAKLSWAETPARHSFAQFPEMKDYQALMDEFAGQE